MALLTRKELRDMCVISTSTLRNYQVRHKIVISGDFIDDSDPLNEKQINKWLLTKHKRLAKIKARELEVESKNEELEYQEKYIEVLPEKIEIKKSIKEKKVEKQIQEKKEPKKIVVNTIKKTPRYGEVPPLPPPKQVPDAEYLKTQHAESARRLKLEDDTKQVTYEKKVLEKEKAELEIQKLKGELIPQKLVSEVIVALGTGFQNNYRNEGEKLLVDIKQKTKMSDKDFAFFKGEFISMVNGAHKNAIIDAKSSVKSLIEQNEKRK